MISLNINYKNKKKGQVMLITAVLFMSISLIIVFGLTNPIIQQAKISSNLWNSKQSYYLSEAGLEDVLYKVKSWSDYSPGSNGDVLNLGAFSATTTVSNFANGTVISASSTRNGYDKYIQAVVKKGVGISLNYGLQVGLGGIDIDNSATINGDVYSNGNIIYTNWAAKINGSVVVANNPNLAVDQANDLPISPSNSIDFDNSASTEDIVQSFKVSTSSPVTMVSLFLKSVGSPSNVIVKIIKDSEGKPSTNSGDILSSGSFSSSVVTASYAWIDVTLSPGVSLVPGTTYWLVLDASSNSANKNYTIAANLDNAYASGTTKIGVLGGAWNNSGYDSYFRIYTGGVWSKITGAGNSADFVGGNVSAHNIYGVFSSGELRCQIGSGNNKSCITNYADPVSLPNPISDSDIQSWKDDAAAGGIINGDYLAVNNSTLTLGPKKIVGNLIIGNSASLTLTGTLWVTGYISMSGNSKLQLSSSYGSNSGVIVADGRIILTGGTINGSGQNGSYAMVVTTSDCPASYICSGSNAADISGVAGSLLLDAPKGVVSYIDGALSQISALGVIISKGGSASLNYIPNLVNLNFISGPSSGFQIAGWRELEQ